MGDGIAFAPPLRIYVSLLVLRIVRGIERSQCQQLCIVASYQNRRIRSLTSSPRTIPTLPLHLSFLVHGYIR